jgi:hypothetical protein
MKKVYKVILGEFQLGTITDDGNRVVIEAPGHTSIHITSRQTWVDAAGFFRGSLPVEVREQVKFPLQNLKDIPLYYFVKEAPPGYVRRIFIRDWVCKHPKYPQDSSGNIYKVYNLLRELSIWKAESNYVEAEDGPDWIGFEFPAVDQHFSFKTLMKKVRDMLGKERELGYIEG